MKHAKNVPRIYRPLHTSIVFHDLQLGYAVLHNTVQAANFAFHSSYRVLSLLNRPPRDENALTVLYG